MNSELLIITEEADGIDLSGLGEILSRAFEPGVTEPSENKALALIEDDFDDVVLEIRQCNVGDGEVCTSCE